MNSQFFLKIFLFSMFCINIKPYWATLGNSLDMVGENQNDLAGYSIAINNNGVINAVGQPGYNGSSGRVQVYQFNNSFWTILGGSDDMIGQQENDQAGWSVAINNDGTILAAGEPGRSNYVGRARAYQYINSTWVAIGGSDDMTGANINSQAGYSVAMNNDGNIIVVGEPGYNGVGRARAYQYSNSSWTAIGGSDDMAGQSFGDQAGYSVAMNNNDGNVIVVGEPGYSGVGRVRAYQYINSSWTAIGGSDDMLGQNFGDQAGYSVAMNNNEADIIVVGEPGWSGNSGRTRVFIFDGNSWVAMNGIENMTGKNQGDKAGSSVAITLSENLSEGFFIAAGEPGYNDIGRVRIYQYNGSSWTAFDGASDIIGHNNGTIGSSVDINPYKTVSVGDYTWNKGQGRANVYSVVTENNQQKIAAILKARPFNLSNSILPGKHNEYLAPLQYMYFVAMKSNR